MKPRKQQSPRTPRTTIRPPELGDLYVEYLMAIERPDLIELYLRRAPERRRPEARDGGPQAPTPST